MAVKSDEKLYGMKQIAGYLGVCRRTAYYWNTEFPLPLHNHFGIKTADKKELDRWKEEVEKKHGKI